MSRSIIRIIWVIYFACVIPSIVTLVHRNRFDNDFKSVAMVADYYQLVELAQTENIGIDNVLDEVKNAGITDLAVLEDTPKFMELRGICTIIEGVGWPGWLTPDERDRLERIPGYEVEETFERNTDWPLLLGLAHDKTHLIFSNPDDFQRIARVAEERFWNLVEVDDHGGMGGVVSISGEPELILDWGFGFDPMLVAELRSKGFRLHPRLKNYVGYSADQVTEIASSAMATFPDGIFIFDGDSVLGYPSGIVTNENMQVGNIEFAEQKGAESQAEKMPTRIVRVHSIEDEEMEVITIERAVQRFTRSVKERGIRLVYLKPFLLANNGSSLLEKTTSMFTQVKASIEKEGFSIGDPSFITKSVEANFITRLATALAFVLSIVLTVLTVNDGKFRIMPAAILLIVLLLHNLTQGFFGVKFAALGVATMAPILALGWLMKRYQPVRYEVEHLRITPWLFTIALWLGCVGIALTGGLMAGGSLISTTTILQIDSFSGVKVALYLPILFAIIAGPMVMLPKMEANFANGLKKFLSTEMKIWHVVLGIIGLVALLVMAERSGNFPLIPVTDVENNFRGWLESAFYARPRTKEFLIGFPALFIGLYIGLGWLLIRSEFMYGGLIAGSIGLTSMVNTFCHIHTPIRLSVYRTGAGIIIGGVIGMVIALVLVRILGRFSKRYGNIRAMEKGQTA